MLHRKNALFYRTLHGSEVGDLFMSLIHTCELACANAFDYLSQLQRHAAELAEKSNQEWVKTAKSDRPRTRFLARV